VTGSQAFVTASHVTATPIDTLAANGPLADGGGGCGGG